MTRFAFIVNLILIAAAIGVALFVYVMMGQISESFANFL